MEKYRKVIRYWTKKDGVCRIQSYDKFFVLALVPNEGVNVGISFKCKDQDEADKIFDLVLGTPPLPVKVLVITEHDPAIIPVALDGGNGYSKELGTACFFGYIEDVFDERPIGA